jgi:AcrR family transcriptional regulator
MPRLWESTIDAHRQAVRDAILDRTAELVTMHGLARVSMSQIAESAGIGRATLYKYFPDLESILTAWHQRQVAAHLQQLAGAHTDAREPLGRLTAVLEAFAFMQQRHETSELAAVLHRGQHVSEAEHDLRGFIRSLLSQGQSAAIVRDDVPAEELAAYCVHALTAARELSTESAVRRLVAITMAAIVLPSERRQP